MMDYHRDNSLINGQSIIHEFNTLVYELTEMFKINNCQK